MIYLLLLGLAEARRKAPVVVEEAPAPNLVIPLVIAFCIILGTIDSYQGSRARKKNRSRPS